MSALAEKYLIGSVLMDSNNLKDVMDIATPEMFCDRMAAAIYKAELSCYNSGETLTPIAIVNRSESLEFPREDLQPYILESIKELDHSAGAIGYAQQIRNDYMCRELSGMMMYASVDLKPSNVADKIGELMANMENLLVNDTSGLRTMADIVYENERTHFTDYHIKRVNTGFEKLDSIIGGMEGGDIVILAARPGVGKSAYSMQTAVQMASQGLKVAIYNLEMRERQIYERMLANASKIALQRVRLATDYLNDEQEIVKVANKKLAKLPISISSGSRRVSKIAAEVKHRDFDVIIIDYLQLITPESGSQNRVQEVSKIIHDIKALAMTLDIPIIVLSQLSRNLEGRSDKEPMMADLRESGDIENDASIIIMLWNLSSQYKAVKVEKNRNGVTGKIVDEFIGREMKFIETDKRIKDVKGFEKAEDNPFE